MMNLQMLLKNLRNFETRRVAVIGDLMLDEYLWGHIDRISAEAPVPILSVVRRESTLGGAGNVVQNLRTLGVQIAAFGVVGDDETGKQIRELLTAHGVDAAGVVSDVRRRSTRKVRLMSLEHGQQVFRLDDESTAPITHDIEDYLIPMVRAAAQRVQVIICSDYMKGVLTDRLLAKIFAAASEFGITTIVAPKDKTLQKYRGANILVPNSRELAQLVGTPMDGDVWLSESGQQLMQRMGLQALLVTRGSDGMSLFENAKPGLRRVDIPTTARSVYDVTGAGDTAIAAFAAALASGIAREDAAHLANLAAGLKVAKRGTATVSSVELQECLREQAGTSRELQNQLFIEASRPVENIERRRARVS
jgi:D-beta-D-heptose 7-phosphate kinase / D-beta-D-heptose 1-phosphate adenosyltransferase